jgi:HNH endonuclease
MAGSNGTRRVRVPQTKESRRRCWDRQIAKARFARSEFRIGQYVLGSYHREATCEGCKRVFPMWRAGEQMRFCSKKCAAVAHGDARRRTPEEAVAAHARASKRESERSRALTMARRLLGLACAHCGQTFVRVGGEKLCSAECRTARRLAKRIERLGYAPIPITIGRRNCNRCGKGFVGRLSGGRGGKGQIFCSVHCNDRYHDAGRNHRQRARYHCVAYEPIKTFAVLERDGWRCQICGRSTPKRLRGTIDMRAPELDHRVPMALGGGHTWDNLQCACRRCNLDKGGSRSVGQMPLFNRIVSH